METKVLKILDVTFDYETVALGADAAPMQLAAVAWNRYSTEQHPFLSESFNHGIDLRDCVMKGLKVDQSTIDWWSNQNACAKASVLHLPAEYLSAVIEDFLDWIDTLKETYKADKIFVWCQGMDFDVPMLKHQCKICSIGIDKRINYQNFCDARSFVLQAWQVMEDDDMSNLRDIYTKFIPDMSKLDPKSLPGLLRGAADPHDALYDSMRSSWNVWHTMKKMRGE